MAVVTTSSLSYASSARDQSGMLHMLSLDCFVCRGGALSCTDTPLLLHSVAVANNSAVVGGALVVSSKHTVLAMNCSFTANNVRPRWALARHCLHALHLLPCPSLGRIPMLWDDGTTK